MTGHGWLTDQQFGELVRVIEAHTTKVHPGCWECSCGYTRSFESSWNYVTPAEHVADQIAEVVAAHRQQAAEKALRDAADELQRDMDTITGPRPLVATIPQWLRDRAGRVRDEKEGG